MKNLFDVLMAASAIQSSNNNERDGCTYILVGFLALLPMAYELMMLFPILEEVVRHTIHKNSFIWFERILPVALIFYLGVHYLAVSRRWLRITLYIVFFVFWGIFALPLHPEPYHNLVSRGYMENNITNRFIMAFCLASIFHICRVFYVQTLPKWFRK